MGQKIIYNQVTEYQTLPQCLMDVEQRHRGKSVITTYDLKGQAHSVKFEEFVADVRALAGSLLTKKLAKKHVATIGISLSAARSNCTSHALASAMEVQIWEKTD